MSRDKKKVMFIFQCFSGNVLHERESDYVFCEFVGFVSSNDLRIVVLYYYSPPSLRDVSAIKLLIPFNVYAEWNVSGSREVIYDISKIKDIFFFYMELH